MDGSRVAPWLRALGGVLVLALLAWRLGTAAFLAGLRVVDLRTAALALGVGVLTTLCCAWRWRRVASGLGLALGLREAFVAYYRSQFLNATLPSGLVGDVHRALRHGREAGDLGLAARAVALERAGSFATQLTIGAAVLLALPSPLPRAAVLLSAAALATVALAVVAARPRPFAGETLAVVVVSSGIALGGHLAVFLLAARAAGSTAPLTALVAPTLLALLAMALPLSVAGWGPREGVAAWAFGAAGLGAAQGVATAVAYGVLAMVACLPGAVVILAGLLRSVPGTPAPVVALRQGGGE